MHKFRKCQVFSKRDVGYNACLSYGTFKAGLETYLPGERLLLHIGRRLWLFVRCGEARADARYSPPKLCSGSNSKTLVYDRRPCATHPLKVLQLEVFGLKISPSTPGIEIPAKK